jgi:cytidylate kinase
MENILLKYMIERFNEAKQEKINTQNNLPFVTISREYGCPAKEISSLLVQKININYSSLNQSDPWRIINKEILEEASRELNINPERINKFFSAEKRGTIDEILSSLTEKYYKSDLKIKKTLAKIIKDFANKGNVVIVGRGGVSATYNINNGIHIRLFAPLEWRAEKIIEKGYCKSMEEAKKLAKEIDFKRNELIRIVSNNCFDESSFNITYNCSFFNNEEITDSIIYHLIIKKLLKRKNS